MPTINPLAEITTTQQQKQKQKQQQQQQQTPMQSSIILANLIPLLLVSLYIIYISYRLSRRRRSAAGKKGKVWICFFPCWRRRYRGKGGQRRKGGYRNIIGDEIGVGADGGMDMDSDVLTDGDGSDMESLDSHEDYSGTSQQETDHAGYGLVSRSLSDTDRQCGNDLDLDLDHRDPRLDMSRYFNPATSRLHENILLQPETHVGSWDAARREVHEAAGFVGWVHRGVDKLVDGAARWVGG